MISGKTQEYWLNTLRGWAEDRLSAPQFTECCAVLDELLLERQKRQDAYDRAAGSRGEKLNEALFEQCDKERSARNNTENALAIALEALDWYAMSETEQADEARDKIEKLLSPEVIARVYRL